MIFVICGGMHSGEGSSVNTHFEEDYYTLQIEEAAKFLINPKVSSHAEDKKSAFLKKKGLSDEEILAAFSKAKTYAPEGKVKKSEGGEN